MNRALAFVSLLSILFLHTARSQEVVWSDGFEYETSEWQFIDNDGDGRNWTISEINPHNGNRCLYGGYSPTAEDNWAISPAIILPDGGDEIVLEWQVFAHESYAECYEVLVTTNNANNYTAYDSLFGEEVTGGYQGRQLILTAYAGQTIHLAFRHLSQNRNFICIDDVSIKLLEQLPPQPPVVTIAAPDTAEVDQEVRLTALSDNADQYLWDIEEAEVSDPEGRTTTAVWRQEGRFRISLTASNDDGSTTIDRIITVISKNGIEVTSGEQGTPLLYPNPTTDMLTIRHPSVIGIDIIDAAGRTIAHDENSTVDVSTLPAGIYTAKVNTPDGTVCRMFLKR